MNEKFGFLSNFAGLKGKKKNHLHHKRLKGELTDNPPVINRQALLTDDESDDEQKARPEPQQQPQQTQPKQVNRILESSSSSNLHDDHDKTYCSELEAAPISTPLFNTDDLNPIHTNSNQIADTVEGTFSHEELCSRISEMRLKHKQKLGTKTKNTPMADTVVGPFSDDSEDEQEVVKAKSDERLKDTIVQSSTDDENDECQMPARFPVAKPQQRVPKPSLPDTIIGFSDSMSELTIAGRQPLPVAQPVKEDAGDPWYDNEEDDHEDDDDYEEEEVITVLDSEEEIEDDEPPLHDGSFENCSSIPASSRGKESDSTLNRFFNNPPSIRSSVHVITHSVIQRHREVMVEEIAETRETNISADRLQLHAPIGDDVSSIDEELEIAQTDCSDEYLEDEHPEDEIEQPDHDDEQLEENNEVSEADVVSDKVVQSQRTHVAISEEQTLPQSTASCQIIITISGKININLKISMRDHSPDSDSSKDSSSSCSSSSSDSLPPSPRKPTETPKAGPSNKKHDSARKEKQAATPGSGTKNIPEAFVKRDEFRTPAKKEEAVIDDDLQNILNNLYGDTWKTPQLLRSCKSKTVRQDLRKSIHANNFDNFVKNLPKDLESTRITSSSSDESIIWNNRDEIKSSGKRKEIITPSNPIINIIASSDKKTPREVTPSKPPTKIIASSDKKTPKDFTPFKPPIKNIASSGKKTPYNSTPMSAPKTPRYLEICDTDTESDDSSDEDFNPPNNETWNASSDEDVEEEERIKKRSIARKSRKDEEIIFVPDDTINDKSKKLNDLLERFEYKKPPSMEGTDTPKKHSKRKLFTHSHYDDELIPIVDSVADKENDGDADNMPDILFTRPFPINKKLQDVRDSAKKFEASPAPSPVVKKPSKTKIKTPKSSSKVEQPLNFKNGVFSFLKSLDVEANPILCDPNALHFRNNYKSKRPELTDKLFKLYNEKVFDNQLADVPVKWNKKLLNTAGRCNNSRKFTVRQSQLELSEKVLTSADRLRCTLIHEMCHAATWILQGENGHGATWKRWAAKSNATFPELPKINVCHDYVIEYRYTYQCVTCKAKYQAHSKNKKVENIRCSICRGSIELFLNKKNKQGEVVMTPVSKEVKGFPKFVKINYKDVKRPNMTHKEVMQVLSSQFACLSVEQKKNL